jgi:hypothetical protein
MQLFLTSSQLSRHSAPPRHGSPVCAEQLPASQLSLPVQNRLSLQGPERGTATQPLDVLQTPSAHGLESSHSASFGVWMQAAPWQLSCVQAMPSSHDDTCVQV